MAKGSKNQGKSLVIVESPAKAKTINKYLGDKYLVKASVGHVRDLPEHELGVNIEHDFDPTYIVSPQKQKIIRELAKAASTADEVYLATDLDREGEAIAWHLAQALGLDERKTRRVIFNEITASAIRNAFAAPHTIDMDRVNAQQARRILDRIAGYHLSPLLWAKVAKGLSAGRVQSVTVRLVVERELEIRAFVPEETWSIVGILAAEPANAEKLRSQWQAFRAEHNQETGKQSAKQRLAWLGDRACLQTELVKWKGESFQARRVEEARAVAEALGFLTNGVEERVWDEYADKGIKRIALRGSFDPAKSPAFRVSDIQTRRSTTRPPAPFTTDTLQQAGATHLRFAVSRTMNVAQALYQGVDIAGEEGPVGLITYMRTDSTNLSAEAVDSARRFIQSSYGPRYLPDRPNVYEKKDKRAQEAHEAIRPTDVTRRPEDLKGKISEPLYRLYDLIWRRFVACQMTPAEWDGTTVMITANAAQGEAVFKATGRRLVFDGFQKVAAAAPSEDLILPKLDVRQELAALDIEPSQQFSAPPPRYSEASLVKAMKSEGIGRPSTYASIIKNIQDRGYVQLLDRRFHATERGIVVTQKLIQHFPKIMDVKFTSYMEDELDKIEESHLDWVSVLREFYEPFKEALDIAFTEMEPVRAEPSEYKCPECGRDMVYRMGKNGRFLACTGYPECKGAMNVDDQGRPLQPAAPLEPCEKCGKPMMLRKSRLGPFLGCTGYPECDFTVPCDDQGNPLRKVAAEDIKEDCPECGSPMRVKFSRGKAFLGCSSYPTCKAISDLPAGVYVERPKPEEAGVHCDKCGRPMVIRRGRRGPFLSCSGFPRCRNAMPMEKIEHLRTLALEGKIPTPPAAQDQPKKSARRGARAASVDPKELGPPPAGFAWTRTGRPVVEVWPEETLRCPHCGGEMVLKVGRFGPYFACAACKTNINLRGEAKKRAENEVPNNRRRAPVPTDVPCPECGENMVIRMGPTGPFLGCSGYPKCRATQPLPAELNELAAQAFAKPEPAETTAAGSSGTTTTTASKAATTRSARSRSSPSASASPAGGAKAPAVDKPSSLPPGFALTRTGKPVVETWPQNSLSCPQCGQPMELKSGRFGPFFGCSDSQCKCSVGLRGEAKKRAEREAPAKERTKPVPTDVPCTECGSPMVIRQGRGRPFLGCSNYPKCKATQPAPEELMEKTA